MASSKNKLSGFLKWIASGWMLILFFVLFFLFWEYSIPLFDVPRYILPAPTEIVQKGSADIDKLIYSIIIGGAVGNFYDRLIYKAVPDFIDLHYNNLHWFVFNVADIFITLGIIALLISSIIKKN